MANTNKKGIVYWLEKIFSAIVGGRPAPAAPSGSGATNTEKKGIIYWLERIYDAITGVSVQTVTDITALTSAQLDSLQVGDKVAKKTGTATHLYTVTYKDAENGGLCLTYEDASVIETVSYDHTASGWEYNSTDKANQGYDIIRPAYADTILHDAEALGQLAGHIQRGTIFDCLAEQAYYSEDGPSRILAMNQNGTSVNIYSTEDEALYCIDIEHTPTQYSGLAAVQRACEFTSELPYIGISEGGYLAESNGNLICVDDKLVTATLDDDNRATAFAITDNTPAAGTDYVNISADDLQKLIGLPITNL